MVQPQQRHGVLAALAVFGSQSSNALGAAWSKSLFDQLGVEGLIALRVGFAALLVGVLTRAWRIRVGRDQIGNLLGYGISLGVMSSIAYQAYARIPVGIGMAIEVTGPLAVVVFNSRHRSDFAWMACTVAGLALLLFRGLALPAVDPVGVAFAFGSAACWASYIVFGKRVSILGGANIVGIGLSIAALFVVPVGFATAGTRLLRPDALLACFAIAMLSSAIPFLLQMLALRQLPARVYGLIASGVPAVGAIMALLVLGETLELRQCLGIALVIAASVGATLSLSTRSAS